MKIIYLIAAQCEGSIDEILASHIVPQVVPKPPSLPEVTAMLGELAFIVETIAHLGGKEQALLPSAERARAMMKALEPITI